MNNNRKEKNSKKIKSDLAKMAVGAVIGVALGKLVISFHVNRSILTIILYGVLFVFSFILQIILHEGGHLIAGLWSGYEFVSFRVGTLTFVKENGKIVRKKFNVAGTGGQCLMMPPEGKGYDCPYFWYNLGGVLMNILISSLCIIVYQLFNLPEVVEVFLICTAISGVYFFLMNGIPMKLSGITNDGYNLLSIGKNKAIRKLFYTQLRVNGLLYQGVRIKDMPLEWFEIPEGVDLKNPMVSAIKLLEGGYYHDRKEFEKAKACYECLLKEEYNLIDLFKNEIQCELLFYEIIGERRKEVIEELYTKALKKYIKITHWHIGRKRLMYAYALLVEKDAIKAEKVLKEIEVVRKTYPAKAEVESELEIIENIKEMQILHQEK